MHFRLARLSRLAISAFVLALCHGGIAHGQGVLVHEVRSAYSHIQIRDLGARRAMLFLGHGGEAALETLMDLRTPHRLQHPYSHTLMAALLYAPAPRSALVVGLGGGAIPRFLNHELPGALLDVVEIDPVVVALARDYFGTVPGERTRIVTADAYDFLARSEERYDLILVNAHLMPDAQTDASGLPRRLAAREFLLNLRARLVPGGAAAFNLIRGRDTAAHITLIRDTFPAVDVFHSAARANVTVVALATDTRPGAAALRERAQLLDRDVERGFSFERVLAEREN